MTDIQFSGEVFFLYPVRSNMTFMWDRRISNDDQGPAGKHGAGYGKAMNQFQFWTETYAYATHEC